MPLSLTNLPLAWSIGLFCLCALVIGVIGTRLTHVVDDLADRTGLGEAIAGALLLGATTSLSGSVLSVTAGWAGQAELAVSNAVGGIAVQTLFLTVADMFLRRVNLEHAAASIGNLMQGALLVCMLSLILVGSFSPEWTLWGIHPITPLMVVGYAYGLRIVNEARTAPMWMPARTRETREDVPDEVAAKSGYKEDTTAAVLDDPSVLAEYDAIVVGAGLAETVTPTANLALNVALTLTQLVQACCFGIDTVKIHQLVDHVQAKLAGIGFTELDLNS